MKHILITTLFAISIAAVNFASAANIPFIGWNKTAAEYKAQMADTNVIPMYRIFCAYMVAQIETPDAVKDLASAETFIRAARKSHNLSDNDADVRNTVISIVTYAGRPDLAKAILRHPDYAANSNAILYIKAYRARKLDIVQTVAERKAVLAEAMPIAVKRNNLYLADTFLKEYIELTAEDKDDDVLPVLRTVYRLALPKLEDAKIKPFVVKLSLALKSRGENVQ